MWDFIYLQFKETPLYVNRDEFMGFACRSASPWRYFMQKYSIKIQCDNVVLAAIVVSVILFTYFSFAMEKCLLKCSFWYKTIERWLRARSSCSLKTREWSKQVKAPWVCTFPCIVPTPQLSQLLSQAGAVLSLGLQLDLPRAHICQWLNHNQRLKHWDGALRQLHHSFQQFIVSYCLFVLYFH